VDKMGLHSEQQVLVEREDFAWGGLQILHFCRHIIAFADQSYLRNI